MNRKHDWDKLEAEYVSSNISLRELARANGIEHHSLVMAQSKRREWARKREEFRMRAGERSFALMANDEARRRAREAQVRDNAIDAIDEAITKMRSDMQATRKVLRDNQWVDEPLVIIKPQDVALLLDRLNVLFGRPSTITEERNLGVSLSAAGALGPEVLRGIVEATRSIAGSSDAAVSPIPRIGGAREN